MKKLVLLTFIITNLSYGQQCDCNSEFQWLKNTIEDNDAGFQSVVKEKGIEYYQFYNNFYEQKVKNVTDLMKCTDLLKSWLKFFRKEHLYLYPIAETGLSSFPKREINIENLKLELEKKDYDFLEGIWEIGDYEVAIAKENKQTIGVIINTSNPNWEKGQIKFILNENLNDGIFFLGDKLHTPKNIENIEYLTKGILILDNFYLKRNYPKHDFSKEELDFLFEMSSTNPFFKQIDENTNYLRVPSFDFAKKDEISDLVDINLKELTSKDNLIIDLRGNGGGADVSFFPLLKILYTNPIVSMGIERLSSKINNESLKEELDFTQMSKDDVEWYTEKINELENNIGKFVDVEGVKFMTNKFDTIYSQPNNIAILIDKNCASSTEEFLLMAKQSKKVKLFGHPTSGALDISNLNEVISPTKSFKLYYGTTKSIRENYKIDDVGIQPDFYLHKYIFKHNWVKYVRDLIE